MVPIQSLDRLVGEKVPAHLRTSWRWIQTRGRDITEAEAERTAVSLATHSAALGFHTANVHERARALGTLELDEHLGLSEEKRYNAEGNAINPEAVKVRLAPLLAAWSQEHHLHVPTLAFLNPSTGTIENLLTIRSSPGGCQDE